MTAKVIPTVTKRQLVLLALFREQRLTIPRAAERFGISYTSLANITRALVHELLATVVEELPRTGMAPPTKVYGPTSLTRRAIRVPLDTPLELIASAEHEPPRAPVRRKPGVGARGRAAGSGVIAGPITIPQFRWNGTRLG